MPLHWSSVFTRPIENFLNLFEGPYAFVSPGSPQYQCKVLCSAVQYCCSARFVTNNTQRYSTSAADNKQPPKLWTALEPELEEALIPRKLAVSPLESWLSLRYSLPPLLEAPLPLEGGEVIEAVVLPPSAVPFLEDGEGSTPLSCKNVLEIRRRKMNRHKYKKLLKRTKFQRRRLKESKLKRKQVSNHLGNLYNVTAIRLYM